VVTEALSRAQVERFIHDGFARIDEAFSPELADQGRAILWRDLPCDPDDPATWTRPVIRLGGYGDEPFRLAANTPRLRASWHSPHSIRQPCQLDRADGNNSAMEIAIRLALQA
jgi:hypothetical protein